MQGPISSEQVVPAPKELLSPRPKQPEIREGNPYADQAGLLVTGIHRDLKIAQQNVRARDGVAKAFPEEESATDAGKRVIRDTMALLDVPRPTEAYRAISTKNAPSDGGSLPEDNALNAIFQEREKEQNALRALSTVPYQAGDAKITSDPRLDEPERMEVTVREVSSDPSVESVATSRFIRPFDATAEPEKDGTWDTYLIVRPEDTMEQLSAGEEGFKEIGLRSEYARRAQEKGVSLETYLKDYMSENGYGEGDIREVY